jgi:S1-C subfamily serine protease
MPRMHTHPTNGNRTALRRLAVRGGVAIAALLLLAGCTATGAPTATTIPSPTAQPSTAPVPGVTATPFTPIATGTSSVTSIPRPSAAAPSAAPPPTATAGATAATLDGEQVYARVSPAVVALTNRQRQGRNTAPTMANAGSGVIYDTRGDIITNRHIIDGAEAIDVTLESGKTVPGVLIGQDPVADLAVVRIAAGDAPGVATLGDSAQARVGQRVIAIGNPQGFAASVSHGIISGTDRSVGSLEGMIQTDAAISPGNSGGPLVNANGEVVGIVTTVVLGNEKAEKLAFAIPSNLAKRLADTLVSDGKVTRPYLGVFTELLTPARADELGAKATRGAYISDITAGTPAAKAGLAKGDVIVKVGNAAVDRPTPLSIVLLDFKPGDTVTLTVNRGGTEQQIPVTFAERPAALDP